VEPDPEDPVRTSAKGVLKIMSHQGTPQATRGLRWKVGPVDLVFVIVVVVAAACVFDMPEVPALQSSIGEQTLNSCSTTSATSQL
jgi:hypothetical protein